MVSANKTFSSCIRQGQVNTTLKCSVLNRIEELPSSRLNNALKNTLQMVTT
jgi:hypothetical protein